MSQASHSFVLRTSGSRNVLALVPSRFRVSRNQDTRSILVPWSLRSPKRRNVPKPYPPGFFFVNHDFGFCDFGKYGYKGYLCPLEPSVAKMPKGVIETFTEKVFWISRLRGSSLFDSRNPKCQNTGDRDFTSQASRLFTLRAPSCRNAKM